MKDREENSSNIIGIVIGIYFMSVMVMSGYYYWVDVKKHDSYLRSIFISPVVGFAKATHWPYYAFIQGKKENKVDPVITKSVTGFFTGCDFMWDANEILKSIRNSNDIIGDLKKSKTLLENARSRLSECNRDTLNQIYPAWGDIVNDKFIPGIEYYLSGAEKNGDRANLARGDALLAEFSNWLGIHLNNILVNLNEKGFIRNLRT